MLAGCNAPPPDAAAPPTRAAASAAPPPKPVATAPTDAAQQLSAVLESQPDEVQARYAARHPLETLQFFGVLPGMTVAEADPGGGWYSRILLEYLGPEGMLIGADYPMGVYRLFNYYSEEELAAKESWSEIWPPSVLAKNRDAASVSAYAIGSMPAAMEGTVDVFLLVRALHNLADFEDEGSYLSTGLAEVYRALKPGGVVGVVQHSGPETHADEWASGANGYLKKSFVIAAIESAGFRFEDESPINENPRDVPDEEESVWRLAPTLDSVEDESLAAEYRAIGESNRMTLRFRKPLQP
jgi:predicted methyltransferase